MISSEQWDNVAGMNKSAVVIKGSKNTSEPHLAGNSKIIFVQLGILPTTGQVCLHYLSAIFSFNWANSSFFVRVSVIKGPIIASHCLPWSD